MDIRQDNSVFEAVYPLLSGPYCQAFTTFPKATLELWTKCPWWDEVMGWTPINGPAVFVSDFSMQS